MSIWHQNLTLEALNALGKGSAVEHLGIEITDIGSDYISGTMPVDHRTRQPMGILHGGANALLAESLGSIAANCCVDHTKYTCVGLEINANHLRTVKNGLVTGTARSVHLGKTIQVWDINIENEKGQLSCSSRLTMMVIKR